MASAIEALLEPLRDFSVARIYASYGPFLDFLLFASLFVSLAHVTIGRRFQHRGLSTTLGLILAVALMLLWLLPTAPKP